MTSSKKITVELIKSELLYADSKYQCEPRSRTLRIIRQEFNPSLFGVLEVAAEADGRFAMLDGQTRTMVAKEMGKLPSHVWCRVHHDLSLPEKALLFVLMNENSTPVHDVKKYLSSLIAEDPTCLAINLIVTSLGLGVGVRTTTSQISSVGCLRLLYEQGTLLRVLTLCKQWAKDLNDCSAFNAIIMRNISDFLKSQTVNDRTLAEKLAGVMPKLVLIRIKGEKIAAKGHAKVNAGVNVIKAVYTGKKA